MATAPTILLVITEDWYFLSHRLALALEAQRRGFRVVVATGPGTCSERILHIGLEHEVFDLERKSTSVGNELRSIASLTSLMRRIRPDLVHLVGAKPIVYGNIAAAAAGWPRVLCAVAGLGYLYLGNGVGRGAMRTVYESTFKAMVRPRTSSRVLVQNSDDLHLLIERRMASPNQVIKAVGAGVDTARFAPAPEPEHGPIIILAHTRMLWDKGIGELVDAVRLLRNESLAVPIVLRLVGKPDDANPASIPRATLTRWGEEGVAEWLGQQDEIPELLSHCHIACLPSYREGAPLSLLEAAAAGRPIVTTDVPGCREVVEHGRNGLLVPAKDPTALAGALRALAADAGLRRRFGQASRERAEREFSAHIINERVMALYREMLSGS